MANKYNERNIENLSPLERKIKLLNKIIKDRPTHPFRIHIEQYIESLQPNLLKINPEILKKKWKEFFPRDYPYIVNLIEITLKEPYGQY